MKLTPVDPIGHQRTLCLAGGRLLPVVEPVYPPSRGCDLRAARQAASVTLRVAARLMKLRASDLSKIEIGAAVPARWEPLFAALAKEGGGR